MARATRYIETTKYYDITQGTNAKAYFNKHKGIVSSQETKDLIEKAYQNSKNSFARHFNTSSADPVDEMAELMETFQQAAQDYQKNIGAYGAVFGQFNDLRIKKTVDDIVNGKISPEDIKKESERFEEAIYKLLNVLANSAPLEAIGGKIIEQKKEYSSAEKQQILNNIDKVQVWLEGETQAAATALKNSKNNLVALAKYLNDNSATFSWAGKTSVPVDEKSPGSMYGSIFVALKNIKGGLAERVMCLEIANRIGGVDKVLVTGADKVEGKSIKGDLSAQVTDAKGNITDTSISAKAGKIYDSKKRISYETTSNLNKFFASRDYAKKIAEPFFMFSHFRNVKSSGNNAVLKELEAMSNYMASHEIERVLGTTAEGSPVHFMAFQETVIPAYKLIEEMKNGNYGLYIGVGVGSSYYPYVKYQGKFTPEDDAKAFTGKFVEAGRKGNKFSIYENYVLAKVATYNPSIKYIGYGKMTRG